MPDCIGPGCPIKFDLLTDEDFRIMEIRFLLSTLGEAGLGTHIVKEYRIDREDMIELGMIEAECRAMAQPQQEEENG